MNCFTNLSYFTESHNTEEDYYYLLLLLTQGHIPHCESWCAMHLWLCTVGISGQVLWSDQTYLPTISHNFLTSSWLHGQPLISHSLTSFLWASAMSLFLKSELLTMSNGYSRENIKSYVFHLPLSVEEESSLVAEFEHKWIYLLVENISMVFSVYDPVICRQLYASLTGWLLKDIRK